MALGGGSFVTQNKVLPGTYINFVSKPTAMGGIGERGVVAIPLSLDWGSNEVFTVESSEFMTKAKSIFGYDYTHEKLLSLRELFYGAKTAIIYRLNGSGSKATVTVGSLVATAKYSGIRGNDISIIVRENIDDESYFDVITVVDGSYYDTQTVSKIEELLSNDFVVFSGEGAFESTAGANLTGGTNSDVNGESYSQFISVIEAYDFNILVYDGDDDITKKLFVSFTKRMRDEEGVKFVTVMHNYSSADHEGVISVKNETEEGKTNLVYWVGGKEASANVNESLTNTSYDGELNIKTKYTKSEFEKAIENGEFVFYDDGENVRVLRDINTFTNFSSEKNSSFSSNRIMRVLDAIGNDVARIFSEYYLGKQSNNKNGRNLFKTELISYHEQLMAIGAIEDFTADDVTVSQGTEKTDVVVYLSVMPVDSMEKLYMKVEIV